MSKAWLLGKGLKLAKVMSPLLTAAVFVSLRRHDFFPRIFVHQVKQSPPSFDLRVDPRERKPMSAT